MKENPTYRKAMSFAIRIVNVYKYLVEEKTERVMSKQLLRSGTSIGANFASLFQQNQIWILFINWQFHKKKRTKHYFGWNF